MTMTTLCISTLLVLLDTSTNVALEAKTELSLVKLHVVMHRLVACKWGAGKYILKKKEKKHSLGIFLYSL
jgi:hypothetical protein